MERVDFSAVMGVLRRHVNEDLCPSQIELVDILFDSFISSQEAADFVFDPGQVCRWIKGQKKLSPQISSFYLKPANQKKGSDYFCFWEDSMDQIISCEFNIDTACVEVKFDDGSIISIDCTRVENEIARNMYEASELDWLVYNAPVDYTVSANIALRRRDFGMLRSIGMEERQIRRMLFAECFSYGRTALLIGIPLGLLCGWGLLGISYNVEEVPYSLPLAELCVAVGTIFLVIFASMTYAMSKLKKDDPIEAIRMENL